MEEFKKVSLKDLIELTTDEIRRDLRYVISDSEVNSFKKYFEDMVIYQTLVDINVCVEVEGNPMFVSTNVSTALTASNIRRNGCLRTGEKLTSMFSDLYGENTLFAKRRVLEMEKEYLGESFESKVLKTLKEVNENEDIINPADLIKIGVCMQDRLSGYTEDHSKNADSKIEFAKAAWLIEKDKYEKLGLTNKPYYQILKDIYEENEYKHYPLVTREALENTAYLTYGLDRDLKLSIDDIHAFYRLNDASRIIDADVIDDYREEVDECFDSYRERHSGKTKTR
jgi:hypothetical protein